MTTVDIILPTYMRADLISETLDSIKAQTYTDWRCWIAEDGKTLETLECIKPFLEDERFQYLPGEYSGTPAKPRNRAIVQGSAPFIAFLDDDDLWLLEKLAQQVEFLRHHPGCVLLGCNGFLWSGQGSWSRDLPLYFKKPPLGRLSYERMLEQNYFINSSVIISRKVLPQSGLINERLFTGPGSEDYDFWLRVASLGEAWLMSEPLVVYRDSSSSKVGSRTRQDRIESYRANAKIYASALTGVEGIPSPLMYPENRRYADACRDKRDFYLAGPRFLGRLRHDIVVTLKKHLLIHS
jgi:glycosyltransferase involved in cell wall biosynthesis